MIVVDASVAVKWYRPDEAGSEKALDILMCGKKLAAPSIIQVEVAAALTRLVREKKLAITGAQKALSRWHHAILSQVISLENTSDDFEAAVELSLTLSHQLQDVFI